MIHLLARALVAVSLGAMAGACGPRVGPDAGNLQPVVLPDLSLADESVRTQLHERHASLERMRNAGGTPATDLAAAYGDLGVLLMATAFPDQAELSLLNAQRLAPQDPQWPFYLGHLYLAKERRDAAATAFARAAELDPQDHAARVWLGEAYLDAGRAADAETAFLEAAAVPSARATAYAGAGRAALARQDYGKAVEHFGRALEADPGATAIHYPLGMAYRGLGDRDRAEQYLRTRGDAWPVMPDHRMEQYRQLVESPMAYESRGLQALGAGDARAAVEALRHGVELAPNDPALRHRLGMALVSAGDVPAARPVFEEVIRRWPSFARAHVSLGTLHNLEGRHDEAVAHYTQAVEHDPQLADAQLGLAESLRVTGRLAASIPHYERAVALDPRMPAAWLGGGLSLIGLHRTREAHEWLTRARQVHAERPEFGELLERLEGRR